MEDVLVENLNNLKEEKIIYPYTEIYVSVLIRVKKSLMLEAVMELQIA